MLLCNRAGWPHRESTFTGHRWTTHIVDSPPPPPPLPWGPGPVLLVMLLSSPELKDGL